MGKKKTLYLVDGANYLFRAFYAIRPLSTSKGFPTNALYGFTQMLLSLKRDEHPDYLAIVFDTPEPTFRDELYADYKANRAEPPDDLVPQFAYLHSLVEALGIPSLEKPGFEADDLIGTIAKRHASDDMDVVLVSGDKDLMQLVGDHISILDTMKMLRIGREEVIQRFGVPPEKVTEVLGLMGDASDNIPGVPGIGPKTATKLIQEYGTIEKVIEHADHLQGQLVAKIRGYAEQALLSRRLATINTEVLLDTKIEELVVRPPNREKSRALFTELEFAKLLTELAPTAAAERKEYRLIQDEGELVQLIDEACARKRFSLDLETTSLQAMSAHIVGVAIAVGSGHAAYVPVGHELKLGERQLSWEVVFPHLKRLLADETFELVGQNLKYDLLVLKQHGIIARGKLFDTMVASYLLNPSLQHGLDAMAELHLGYTTIRYEDVTGKGKKQIPFFQVALEVARDYAAEDADIALRLADFFGPKLVREGLFSFFRDLEMPLLRVLLDMEEVGVSLDVEQLKTLSKEFEGKLQVLEEKIYREALSPFNINSPQQLGDILFGKLQLPGAKRTKTGFSTSQDILEELSLHHPLPRLVLTYRSFAKLKSTYVDALPQLVHRKTGRVHTSFNQAVAATGRLSSSDPNLQNIPIRSDEGLKIRRAFVAADGSTFVDCDYSQIELRVLAHMSGDECLIEAFRRGTDVHAMTAAGIFGCAVEGVTKKQRAVGKTVNFATIYGQGAYGLSRQLDIDPKEAAQYIERYFERYPRVAAYRDEVLKQAEKEGMVTTLFGRRRHVPDIKSPNQMVRQAAERVAFNTVFQGTAADIIKRAMLTIHAGLQNISPNAKMILQVHDELIFEVPTSDVEKVKAFVVEEMSSAADLAVPLVVDVGIGTNWADAH